jgi:glucose-6-phosphate 1-dehydrogenase
MSELVPPSPQAIVIFGASGDLTRRKILPALYNLAARGLLPDRYAVVGYARSDLDDGAFRAQARQSLETFSRTPVDDGVFGPFADSLSFVSGSFEGRSCFLPLDEHLARIDERMGTEGRRLYYCATPPSAFPVIARRLGECRSQARARIVIEKPFGRDLRSAGALGSTVHEVFDESQVFRIDHYLGKETVQNILMFRFANAVFERLWNREAIDHVQITIAEAVGMEGRGRYYEEAGAVRDMVQNHLLQVLSFVAMEPPRSLEPEAIRDEKVKLLLAMRPFGRADVVRGRYTSGVVGGQEVPGYLDEGGWLPSRTWRRSWRCAPASTTGAGTASPSSCEPASACLAGRPRWRSSSGRLPPTCSRGSGSAPSPPTI